MESKCKIISLSLLCLWGINEIEVFGIPNPTVVIDDLNDGEVEIGKMDEFIETENNEFILDLNRLTSLLNQIKDSLEGTGKPPPPPLPPPPPPPETKSSTSKKMKPKENQQNPNGSTGVSFLDLINKGSFDLKKVDKNEKNNPSQSKEIQGIIADIKSGKMTIENFLASAIGEEIKNKIEELENKLPKLGDSAKKELEQSIKELNEKLTEKKKNLDKIKDQLLEQKDKSTKNIKEIMKDLDKLGVNTEELEGKTAQELLESMNKKSEAQGIMNLKNNLRQALMVKEKNEHPFEEISKIEEELKEKNELEKSWGKSWKPKAQDKITTEDIKALGQVIRKTLGYMKEDKTKLNDNLGNFVEILLENEKIKGIFNEKNLKLLIACCIIGPNFDSMENLMAIQGANTRSLVAQEYSHNEESNSNEESSEEDW